MKIVVCVRELWWGGAVGVGRDALDGKRGVRVSLSEEVTVELRSE